MTCVTDFWNRLDKFERILVVFIITFAAAILVTICCYRFFGQALIEKIYHGQAPEVLNNLIKYQYKKPLEYYLKAGDLIFKRLVFIASFSLPLLLGIVLVIYRLICTEKKVNIGFVVLLSMLLLALFYYLNPSHRIYSYHGFFRASIVYQILSGNIPPKDFLFAGQTLRWPWGFAWFIAQISKLLHISPFYSFAIVNIVTLGLAIFIIYQISKLLIPNNQANIFSSLFSIFGVSIFSREIIIWLFELCHLPFRELRALPPFLKYTNINGMPTGLVFFLLFVYFAIRLFENRNVFLFFIMLFISTLACGFIYTGFIPAILASVIVIFFVHFLPWSKNVLCPTWKPLLLLVAATILAGLLLKPYIQLASSGMGRNIEVFNLQFVMRNIAVFFFFMFPIQTVISFSSKNIKHSLEKRPLILVVSIAVATIGSYFCLHFPHDVEYKFLLLSGMMSGILGGIAFYYIAKNIPKFFTLILLGAFLFPSASSIATQLTKNGNHPVLSATRPSPLVEKGIYVRPVNRHEDALYQWIIRHTPIKSVFVDTEWLIPVYAQRRLLFGMDRPDGVGRIGFTMDIDYLNISLCYEPKEFAFRESLVKNIYSIESTMPRNDILGYLFKNNVYIVVRNSNDNKTFNSEGLDLLFKSTNGEFSLYGLETQRKPMRESE